MYSTHKLIMESNKEHINGHDLMTLFSLERKKMIKSDGEKYFLTNI